MEAVELTEFLIKNLVKQPDMISVKEFNDDEELTVIQVLVDDSDMGAVIGRSGNIAKALRTLIQASSYANQGKKVRIDIDSF